MSSPMMTRIFGLLAVLAARLVCFVWANELPVEQAKKIAAVNAAKNETFEFVELDFMRDCLSWSIDVCWRGARWSARKQQSFHTPVRCGAVTRSAASVAVTDARQQQAPAQLKRRKNHLETFVVADFTQRKPR